MSAEQNDKARALAAHRSAVALVTASIEQQQGHRTVESMVSLVRTELEDVEPVALVGALAGLAGSYVVLLAHGTGKTPNEIINLGAMAVEEGQDDL